jgi:hypothetical protein
VVTLSFVLCAFNATKVYGPIILSKDSITDHTYMLQNFLSSVWYRNVFFLPHHHRNATVSMKMAQFLGCLNPSAVHNLSFHTSYKIYAVLSA